MRKVRRGAQRGLRRVQVERITIMKVFKESHTSYKTIVSEKRLTIEIPISTLVSAFNYYPNCPDGTKVKRGKAQDFAELCAKHLHDEIDQETGASHITAMFDGLFEHFVDGFIDADDIVNFPDGC
jgi:hypothetical protein